MQVECLKLILAFIVFNKINNAELRGELCSKIYRLLKENLKEIQGK
jgi:hypothetical protein